MTSEIQLYLKRCRVKPVEILFVESQRWILHDQMIAPGGLRTDVKTTIFHRIGLEASIGQRARAARGLSPEKHQSKGNLQLAELYRRKTDPSQDKAESGSPKDNHVIVCCIECSTDIGLTVRMLIFPFSR